MSVGVLIYVFLQSCKKKPCYLTKIVSVSSGLSFFRRQRFLLVVLQQKTSLNSNLVTIVKVFTDGIHNANYDFYIFFAGGDPVLLSGGIHSFPFKLGLPLGLPSTFLGKHGWVQYFCKAALREETGLTHKNQQVFIIMNPIDLNLEPPILAVRLKKILQ